MVKLKTHSVAASFVFLILIGMTGYSQASEDSFFGMKIEHIQANENRLSVTTTGAIYILEQNRMEMWRRIDPATNTNFPRLVAVLEFDTDVGTISLASQTEEETKIHTNPLEFTFYADSLVCIKANASFSYRHINRIENALWNKPNPAHWGSSLDRMWTNGYGGSLHAVVTNDPNVIHREMNETQFILPVNAVMSHMVFPPKPFDFEKLYGPDAKPHWKFIWDTFSEEIVSQDAMNGIGCYMLTKDFYVSSWKAVETLSGEIGYEYKNPAKTKAFIGLCSKYGIKCIMYCNAPANWGQPWQNSYSWLIHFIREYELSGVYLDNAYVTPKSQTGGHDYGGRGFWETYLFVKSLRSAIGNNGVIIHHNSVDPWGVYSGLRAVMIDCYCDYTITGEVGPVSEIQSTDDPAFRFLVSNYGLSNAFGCYHPPSQGKPQYFNSAIANVAAARLGCAQRKTEYGWSEYLAYFNERRQEYLSDIFKPDMKWSVDCITYTITATASQGGSITPAGKIQVPLGESVKYNIIPAPGYRIADVLVNGVSEGVISSYTFQNVHENYLIDVQFAIQSYTISATTGKGGTIEPSGDILVEEGENQNLVIVAAPNYYIEDVVIDNISQGALSGYTFHNVKQDHTLNVLFGEVNINMYDNIAPKITNCAPLSNSIQVPRNSLIKFHVIDSETGVDPNSIEIQIQSETIYAGGVAQYNSARGCCRRIGAPSDYCFVYQPNKFFDFDQEIQVNVIASDRAGNAMTDSNAYSFQTEMRRFGGFQSLHPDSGLLQNRPRTVCDGLGALWVVWESGPEGSRNIYISRLLHSISSFDDAIQITNLYSDQCRPAIAVDNQNKIYVVWQDHRRGNWDIYLRTSTDGRNWSPEISLIETDQDKANQTNPRIAVASDNTVYVVWQDDRHGNEDIYLASSSNGYAVKTVLSMTTDKADQTQPNIVVDADDHIFIVWTDARHDSSDIFGASSVNNWMNVPVVNNAANQTQPAIATESEGSILHLTWTDDSNGNKDIFYAATEHGLPDSPLKGVNIVDDSKGADQTDSAVITSYNGGSTPMIYICWQDARNVITPNQDQDIYFTEGMAEFGVNILVTDEASEYGEGYPALGVDSWGLPYLVWSSSNDGMGRDIVYGGTTRIQTPPLAEKEIPAHTGGYVGANPENISSLNDVCVEIPAGAFWSDLKVGIMKIENPSVNSLGSLIDVDTVARFEFGPSSPEEFAKPVVITIPYESDGSDEETIYWFNPKIDDLSQSGISNVERIAISDTLYALRFTTTHFTQYVVATGRTDTTDTEADAGGGSGGGCTLSRYPADTDGIEIFEFFLPFIVLMGILFWLTQKEKKSQNNLTLSDGKQRISADSEGRTGTDRGEISP